MKAMSMVSAFFGVLLVLAGLGGVIWGGWISYRQWLALDALRSADVQTATLPLAIGAVGLLLGGFLVGLAVGRPRKVIAPVPVPPAEPTA
ncbi:MAG TPA: hypothetical protein VK903_05185 [Propionicimonas sp.]|nr:hypothetical protein [Propionicimonas sp.]